MIHYPGSRIGLPLDNNVNITLKTYVDPKKQAEILADHAWLSYEDKKKTIQEYNTEPIRDLADAFFGYWRAENYDKTLSVSREIKRIINDSFPDDDYLNNLADLYELIGLYLIEDYASAKVLGEGLIDKLDYSDELLLIRATALDFISSVYRQLGLDEAAIEKAEESYQLRLSLYGPWNNETIRAKFKYDLYKGMDASPKEAIDNANAIYKFYLKTEGKHGDNTTVALSNLSSLLSSFGAHNQALMADALLYKIFEQKHGKDDRLTLYSLQDMAIDISHIDEDSRDAEVLAKYAYNRAALTYGGNSLEAANALSTRAIIDRRIGTVGRACLTQEKSYRIIESLYGTDHPRTMMNKEVLADAYRAVSNHERGTRSLEKALQLDREVLEWKRELFGDEDKSTIEIEETVIFDRYLLGEKLEALDLQTKLIIRCEQIFGPDNLFAIERYLKLSYMESGTQQYEKALATDQFILRKIKSILSDEHPYILKTVDNIVYDLLDLNRLGEAADFAYNEAVKRVELLGEHHEQTQKMIDLCSDIRQQMRTVVHYFNYHVPKFMGFELQKAEDSYELYYSEGDGVHSEDKKYAEVSEDNVKRLVDILAPAVHWKDKYTGEPAPDGEGFELEVNYDDIRVNTSGKFAFPENYVELHEKVLVWIDFVLNEAISDNNHNNSEQGPAVLPEDKKGELNKASGNELSAEDQLLDEVRFNVRKKNYKHALELIEPLAHKIDEILDGGMYKNDSVNEYFSFDELFECILYIAEYEPKKEIKKVGFQASEIYFLYGVVLIDNNRAEDAQTVLKKAMRWNPMNAKIAFEHAETYKISGDFEEFFRLSREIFPIAFKRSDLARCYRNLAYYFVEKEQWDEAIACNRISLSYDEESKAAQSELYYIHQMVGESYREPTTEELSAYAEKYGFPIGPDRDVLKTAFSYGRAFIEEKNSEMAKYFLNIIFDLTGDPEIKKIIDGI